MNKEIGVATIQYNEQGIATSASFVPTIEKTFGDDELLHLAKATSEKANAAEIRQNADTVLAHWFGELTEIELADRSEQEIVSEVIECEKHTNGGVKKCVIRYVFKDVVRDKNYDVIHIGDSVEVPNPTSEDNWNFSFVGHVEEIDEHGYCIVVDGDGDAFAVEPERLEIYPNE